MQLTAQQIAAQYGIKTDLGDESGPCSITPDIRKNYGLDNGKMNVDWLQKNVDHINCCPSCLPVAQQAEAELSNKETSFWNMFKESFVSDVKMICTGLVIGGIWGAMSGGKDEKH